MSNGSSRGTVPNSEWGRADPGNATKHHNQIEVRYAHDSEEVIRCVVKRLNAEDGMGTYEKLGCLAKLKKRKLGRWMTGLILCRGMGQHSEYDRAFIDSGRPD